MKIGIVGARLSGSYAAQLLAGIGHEVFLFDNSVEKEKPCGGGVTYKALRKMPWLPKQFLPHSEIAKVQVTTHDGYACVLPLPHPIRVVYRPSLDSFLLNWAVKSGAHFIPERVKQFQGDNHGWEITTSGGKYELDYLIGADGATSSVRASLLKPFLASELILTLGYRVPELPDPNSLRICYQERQFTGYIWSFPCADHSSVGIGRWLPEARSADLKSRIDKFVETHFCAPAGDRQYFAALVPSLSRDSLIGQRVCGEKWALLGDAAGFADGITAEGIYYALRSAELLAESIRGKNPLTYETSWRAEFAEDLLTAAAWRDRFYSSSVLSQPFTRRCLQAVKHSPTVRHLLDDTICGKISYKILLRNLVLHSPKILTEVAWDKAKRLTIDE